MPVPAGPLFFVLSGIWTGRISISIFVLTMTFRFLLQCGHLIEKAASELKTASLKMMLVQ